MNEFPRPMDLQMLGLTFQDEGRRSHFTLVPEVARHDGALYGGTAIAVSVAAMEAATGRPSLWLTTQYVAMATPGDVIECTSDVLATGRNVTQVQTVGRVGDRVIFVSVGSTATPRPGGLEGQFQQMPQATTPEEAPAMDFGAMRPDHFRGFTVQVEYRLADLDVGEGSSSQLAMWARLRGDRPATPASIAFVADMVPGAIARAAGLVGGGASLDNSLRFGRIPDDVEWVLLELKAHMAVGSHAHGSVNVWSPDGLLLAVGGQSANMTRMVKPEDARKLLASD
jgi:acyl-CoA thioesterase II